MSGKTALSAAALALALLAGGCKGYETQGNAQRAGQGPVPAGVDDPVYRSSSGVHGDDNTLAGRTGTFNASGHRGGSPKR